MGGDSEGGRSGVPNSFICWDKAKFMGVHRPFSFVSEKYFVKKKDVLSLEWHVSINESIWIANSMFAGWKIVSDSCGVKDFGVRNKTFFLLFLGLCIFVLKFMELIIIKLCLDVMVVKQHCTMGTDT